MKRERPDALRLMIVCCIEQYLEERTISATEIEYFDAIRSLITTRYTINTKPYNWRVAKRIAAELFDQ